jgi:hypothetical protein
MAGNAAGRIVRNLLPAIDYSPKKAKFARLNQQIIRGK